MQPTLANNPTLLFHPAINDHAEAGAKAPLLGVVTLSEVLLQDLRVERAHTQILHMAADTSLQFPDTYQPVIYTALEGSTQLVVGDQQVTLAAGDSALIFYGDGHQLGDGPNMKTSMLAPRSPQNDQGIRHVGWGEGERSNVVLQTLTELTYLRRHALTNRAAPNLLVMPASGILSGEDAVTRLLPPPVDVRRMIGELEGPGSLALANALANLQLCHALKQYTSRLWGNTLHDVRCPNTRRIAMVMREIYARPDREWSVVKLAKHVGLSRSAFAAAFHEVTGEAPIAFLTRTRMERAAKLLRSETLTMYEIGQRVGYPIESSFARAFKRHWGVAPRAFVDQAGGGEPSTH